MMEISMALLTCGRSILNVATPSETVRDSEFMCPSPALGAVPHRRVICQPGYRPSTSIMLPGRGHCNTRRAIGGTRLRPAGRCAKIIAPHRRGFPEKFAMALLLPRRGRRASAAGRRSICAVALGFGALGLAALGCGTVFGATGPAGTLPNETPAEFKPR